MIETAQNATVSVGSGDPLDVRLFTITERMSGLFELNVIAVSEAPDLDFEAIIGQPMSFTIHRGHARTWAGICSHVQQLAAEERGLSTYQLTLVPTLWLLTQRRNHRMFQLMSEIDIVQKVLGEWGISPVMRLTGTYKKRKYRVQYGESDYTFLCRMLEDAGVSFYFDAGGGESALVLDDGPQGNGARAPLFFRDNPTASSSVDHASNVRVGRRLRPGKYTLRDHDYRRPADYKLLASAGGSPGVEAKLERFHYVPGAFLFESDKGGDSPSADDKGSYRTDEAAGNSIAERRLDAKRADAKTVSFSTNVQDLAPGVVVLILDHPKGDLGAGKPQLVTEVSASGDHAGEWSCSCTAVSANAPYRPALVTPKPKAVGVESATVVGPAGEEIHVDEFGRVRVHFHWDRESQMDERSSCWLHVSQPWGGTGFGGSALPRVGQEVIVDFLGGDPDRPIITGRVYTNLQKTPYKLPDNKTQSGLKSNSTNKTGGYNELMFEDAAGRELVRMQAEKDLNKLVKHDEDVTIGNDRTKQIGRDDSHDVGRDRQRTVGRDESVDVGQDRTRTVGRDEKATIGQDRATEIGRDYVQQVGQNKDITIGKDLTKNVAENERETTGQNRTISVGQNRSSDIGLVDSISAGEKVYVEIKPPEGEGESSSSGSSGGGSPTSTTMTDKKIVLTTGAGATITMDGAKVTIEADTIEFFAKKNIKADAESEDVVVHAKKDIALGSDQTIHVATAAGVIDVSATGGNVALTTDQSAIITATADFAATSKTALIAASAGAVVSGGPQAALTAASTLVQGSSEVLVTGAAATVTGGTVAIDGGATLIKGAPVSINP